MSVENEPSLNDDQVSGPTPSWLTFRIAMWSMALAWFAMPPIGLWFLAWIAPIPIFLLCGFERLPGTKPYRALWLAGFAYWLATFYFIPIPHWALFFGWLTVSAYLACYTPLLVAGVRGLVHSFKFPLWLAAPIVWVGIDWMRCNFFTGMGMASLPHSQYEQTVLIQVADLFGAYTLSFAIAAFAAGLVGLPIYPQCCERKTSWLSPAVSLAVLGAVIGYGTYRLGDVQTPATSGLKVALIQGSVDTNLTDRDEERDRKFKQYRELTWQAREQNPDLDLIVWPEANLPVFDVVPVDGKVPKGFEGYDYESQNLAGWQVSTGYPDRFNQPVSMLAGTLGSFQGEDVFNSVVRFNESGEIVDRYFKGHLVMYGEFYPILDSLPVISKYFQGIAWGEEPGLMEWNGIKISPTICFESTVPHFIRNQINELADEGREPDAMFNITNDGWFYGTSCLDFHFACNVFRAVENRKPMYVCANTGLSGEINSNGEILQRGPRRDTQILTATVGKSQRTSLYRTIGDVVPIGMALLTGLGVGSLLRKRN